MFLGSCCNHPKVAWVWFCGEWSYRNPRDAKIWQMAGWKNPREASVWYDAGWREARVALEWCEAGIQDPVLAYRVFTKGGIRDAQKAKDMVEKMSVPVKV